MARQDLSNVFGSYDAPGARDRFFIHHSGVLLQKRLSSPTLGISLFIRQLVNTLLKLSDPNSETLRDHYTERICNAFSGLSSCPWSITDRIETSDTTLFETTYIPMALPAAAAAIGNIKMFQAVVSSEKEIFDGFRDIFPNALRAAVANNEQEIVQIILDRTISKEILTIRFLGELEIALRVAARTGRTEIGNTIIEFLVTKFPDQLPYIDFKYPIYDSIEYNSHDLLHRLLTVRATVQPPHPPWIPKTRPPGLPMTGHEVRHLFEKSSRTGLITFLQAFFPDPKMRLDDWFPLHIAFLYCRFDLARILLDHGADIDMR